MTRVAAVVMCLGLGAAASAAPAAKGKGDPAKGKIVFEQCSMCHNPENTEKKVGPGMKGLFKRAKLTGGQKVTDQTVRAKIEAGGNGMPAYKDMLSAKEIDDVIAFLKTL